jgi:hypothetical protein
MSFTPGIFSYIVEAVNPGSVLNEIGDLNTNVLKEIITEDDTPPITWIDIKQGYYNSYITSYTRFSIWANDGPWYNTSGHPHEWIPKESAIGNYTIYFRMIGPKNAQFYWNGNYYDCDGTWYTGLHSKPVAWQLRDGTGQILPGRYNVQYWAEDDLGNTEATIHTEWFLADVTEPHTQLLFTEPYYDNNGQDYISADTSIILDANDGIGSGIKLIKYWIDNDAKRTYTEPFNIGAEGDHTIHYYSHDYVNHIEDEHTVRVFVDNTAPSTTLKFFGDTHKNGETVWLPPSTSLQLSSSDSGCGLKTIYYCLNDDTWMTYNESFTLNEGTYTLDFYAEDHLGNTEVYTKNRIGVDSQAPEITFNKPETNQLYIGGRKVLTVPLGGNVNTVILGPVDIQTVVNDIGCGIQSINLFIDGEKRYTSYGDTLDWEWNKRTIGVHSVEIVAQDKLGHINNNQLKIWVFNL